jgi:hypothetical protein
MHELQTFFVHRSKLHGPDIGILALPVSKGLD